MSLFAHFARFFMAMRDCIVPQRSLEAQEEIVADLHSCLEQLNERLEDMETRIQNSTHGILVHGKSSQNKDLSIQERIRERSKAKQCLLEKRRVQCEYDKMQKNAFLIQNQIDAIVSSQLNMVVVDAMKQFSHNAEKLSLPSRTMELEALEEHLSDRTKEMMEFQEAMNNASNSFQITSFEFKPDGDLDAELMQELNSYFDHSDTNDSPPVLIPEKVHSPICHQTVSEIPREDLESVKNQEDMHEADNLAKCEMVV